MSLWRHFTGKILHINKIRGFIWMFSQNVKIYWKGVLFAFWFPYIPIVNTNVHRCQKMHTLFDVQIFIWVNHDSSLGWFLLSHWAITCRGFWRGPWLGIEPGTSRTWSQHYTTRLSRRRYNLRWVLSLSNKTTLQHACKVSEWS